jgi:hypothetical protein
MYRARLAVQARRDSVQSSLESAVGFRGPENSHEETQR